MFLSRKAQPPPLAALRYGPGLKEKILIDGPTHLGRAEFPKRCSPREPPKIFRKAKIAVVIDRNDREISRNHALLAYESGTWSLYDLNSKNGTFVCGQRLEAGRGRRLINNDKISIGTTTLAFTTEVKVENLALLVGCPGIPDLDAFGGIMNNLDSMQAALEKRGSFNGNITRLYKDEAKKQAILHKLRVCASLSSSGSFFIFYYSGHGSESGLALSCRFPDALFPLSPHELYSELSNIRGSKLVLLDNCRASKFLKGVPPETLVISGESPEGYLYTGPVTMDGGSGWQAGGFLSRSFVKLLDAKKDAFNLKTIANALSNYRHLVRMDVEVFAHGVTIEMPPMEA
jgi:hypothetical protein